MRFKAIIFDWGDTVMRDYNLPGPMSEWEKADWVPGLQDQLRRIKGEYTLAIATSAAHSGSEEMIKALQRVGADKFFDRFFTSRDLGVAKPDPEFFAAITDKLGYSEKDCLAVGNLYEKDITPAKEAGLSTIFFNESGEEGFCPHADAIIHRMDELISTIRKLEIRR